MYCKNCGSEFPSKNAKQKKQSPDKKKLDSYIVLGISFITAILIILLIYKSNTDSLNNKLNTASKPSQKSENTSAQPSMDAMRQIQLMKENWNKNPASYEANIQLGNAYFDISRYEEAIKYYVRANKANPNQPPVLIDLGISYFNVAKSDSAIIYIEQALQIDPNHLYGLYNSGVVYYNTDRVDDALSAWRKLISIHDGTREAQNAKKFIEQIENQMN